MSSKLARFLSILLHPVFVPVFMFACLVFFSPSLFVGLSDKDRIWWLITMAYTSLVFPLLTVFLLWRLKFISSLNMPNIKERIAPLIASMLFYFWIFWLFHKQFHAPHLIQSLLLGVFLTTVMCFMANIFFKISLHAAAWGSIAMFTFLCFWQQVPNSLYYFLISLILAGVVGAARLALKEHKPSEVYLAYLAGFFAQWIAYIVIPLI